MEPLLGLLNEYCPYKKNRGAVPSTIDKDLIK
jgi:hypothetical protein